METHTKNDVSAYDHNRLYSLYFMFVEVLAILNYSNFEGRQHCHTRSIQINFTRSIKSEAIKIGSRLFDFAGKSAGIQKSGQCVSLWILRRILNF